MPAVVLPARGALAAGEAQAFRAIPCDLCIGSRRDAAMLSLWLAAAVLESTSTASSITAFAAWSQHARQMAVVPLAGPTTDYGLG